MDGKILKGKPSRDNITNDDNQTDCILPNGGKINIKINNNITMSNNIEQKTKSPVRKIVFCQTEVKSTSTSTSITITITATTPQP